MAFKYTSHAKEFLDRHQDAVDRALEICGGTAEAYAVVNITRNGSVDTGNLRSSIAHKQVSKNTEAIGSAVEYAPYVELGHHQTPGRYVPAIKKRLKASWVPGKPFLRPAVENHKDEYANIIKTELSEAAE